MKIDLYYNDSTISKDGTIIGYRKLGKGPRILLIHGALMSSHDLMKLAAYLSKDFEVFILDRRGRGLSGSHGLYHNLAKETEDVLAIVEKEKLYNIFGLSSGANVALHAAYMLGNIYKIALYEPPISDITSVNYNKDREFDQEINELIEKGEFGRSLVLLIKASGESKWSKMIPNSILERWMTFVINLQAKHIKGGEISLLSLIPTIKYDLRLELESEKELENYRSIKSIALLLHGNRSSEDVVLTLHKLNGILQNSKIIRLAGLSHSSPANNGKPEIIAKELKLFFQDDI